MAKNLGPATELFDLLENSKKIQIDTESFLAKYLVSRHWKDMHACLCSVAEYDGKKGEKQSQNAAPHALSSCVLKTWPRQQAKAPFLFA